MEESREETQRTRALRRWYHRYRDGRVRIGHPLIRRTLLAFIPRRVRATLRGNVRMELDLTIPMQQTLFWLNGDLEPQLSWAIREFVPDGGAFVDCGANTGWFGLEARARRHARSLFIEPHPRLAATIRANLELNGWTDACALVEAAASDQPGVARLFVCRDNDGSHSLLPDWTAGQNAADAIEVQLARLDDILAERPEFARVDLMKVDTEGHDLKALQGLGERLNPENVACLYTELGRDRGEAMRLLRDRGYVGFLARGFPNGVEMRHTARRAESGAPVCFFVPDADPDSEREVLWCGQGSPAVARLRELARLEAAR